MLQHSDEEDSQELFLMDSLPPDLEAAALVAANATIDRAGAGMSTNSALLRAGVMAVRRQTTQVQVAPWHTHKQQGH